MLRPLRDRIVVKPLERVRSDTLLVVDSEPPLLGQVVATGPGKRTKRGIEPLDVQVGDIIRFGADYLKFPEYREGAEKYLVLQEADVAGVVCP
jgi:co-chaperonin GroES (HSP10)